MPAPMSAGLAMVAGSGDKLPMGAGVGRPGYLELAGDGLAAIGYPGNVRV